MDADVIYTFVTLKENSFQNSFGVIEGVTEAEREHYKVTLPLI
jgi:hypothetical protein